MPLDPGRVYRRGKILSIPLTKSGYVIPLLVVRFMLYIGYPFLRRDGKTVKSIIGDISISHIGTYGEIVNE